MAKQLWLPPEKLRSAVAHDLPAGSLVALPKAQPSAPMTLGIRFDFREEKYIYLLSPHGQAHRGPCMGLNISHNPAQTYVIDIQFSVETDVLGASNNPYNADILNGWMVLGEEGPGLTVSIARYNSFPHVCPISTRTWQLMDQSKLTASFKNWRIRLDIPSNEPLTLEPSTQAENQNT